MPGRRIFAAIELTDDTRHAIAAYIDELRSKFGGVRVGWEKPEKLHITLKFLPKAAEDEMAGLQAAADKVAVTTRPFTAQIVRTGLFPNAKKPRVLWLGIGNDEGRIARIGREIDQECQKLGSPAEKRRFTPHLTIARIREPHKGIGLTAFHSQKSFPPVAFDVNELVIYESTLSPAGSVYRVLSRHPFGVAGSGG